MHLKLALEKVINAFFPVVPRLPVFDKGNDTDNVC